MDGVYFSHTHSVNDGRFLCETIQNSVGTTADSGITFVRGLTYFYDLKIVVDGLSFAHFYINGMTVSTITTNIPTSFTGLGVGTIRGATGVTGQIGYSMDYISFRKKTK